MKKTWILLTLLPFLVGCNELREYAHINKYDIRILNSDFDRGISGNVASFYAEFNYNVDDLFVLEEGLDVINYSFKDNYIFLTVEFLNNECYFQCFVTCNDCQTHNKFSSYQHYCFNGRQWCYGQNKYYAEKSAKRVHYFLLFEEQDRPYHIANMVILSLIDLPLAAVYFGLYTSAYLT